jgi:hypothetical protein
MRSSTSTEKWKWEAINQVHDVVDGLNKSTKTANSIEEVNTALAAGEIKAYFDEKTKGCGIKHEDEFDTSEEKDDLQKAKSIVMKIFECVKGMVLDSWIMLKEREDLARQTGYNQSKRVFETTSQREERTNSEETGSGVMKHEVDLRVRPGIHTYCLELTLHP